MKHGNIDAEVFFTENNQVTIDDEYDVIVVGGGIAGVSAALAAKRKGCRTLIIEKSVMLGGLATLGLIAIYLPLCDGKGRKVIGGIPEELLHLSIKYGYDSLPAEWQMGVESTISKSRYMTEFSPPEFVIAMDELIEKEGIDVLFDTVFCRPVMEEGGICKGIIVENKSGRVGYRGKVIIDATGDADVFFRAGAKCVEADNWLSYWAYSVSLKDMRKALDDGEIMHGIDLEKIGGDNAGRMAPASYGKYKGTDAWDVSRFIQDGRRMFKDLTGLCKNEERSLLTLPGMAQFRTTRRICGLYEMTEADVYKHFEDSIGCAGDWRKPGPVFEIPYRSLLSEEIKNIAAAGRIISSGGDAWEVTRVIPVASLTGQAAGMAASIAVRHGCSLQEVPLKELQEELHNLGVVVHCLDSAF